MSRTSYQERECRRPCVESIPSGQGRYVCSAGAHQWPRTAGTSLQCSAMQDTDWCCSDGLQRRQAAFLFLASEFRDSHTQPPPQPPLLLGDLI